MRQPRSSAGFTLLEILIAMVILMVGLLGILAVFPTAMRSASRAVEDTYCASIAQSVVDAIHLGLRSAHATTEAGNSYLILDHDGVRDLDTDRKNGTFQNFVIDKDTSYQKVATRDYCITLPPINLTGAPYLYPRKKNDPPRKPPNMNAQGPNGKKMEVTQTYKLGKDFGKDQSMSQAARDLEAKDPYPQYSFAFTIRPCKGPDPTRPTVNVNQQQPIAGLYEVVVMVYRNFDPNPMKKANDPVREFVTYVSE